MSNYKVLLLNQSYEPLQGIPLKKAMKHLCKNKAEVVHYDENYIYSGKNSWKIPTVIRLTSSVYNKVHRFEPRYSKKGIHARDNYTCGYCEKRFKESDLTVDHIVPRSKGGISSWTNCITACRKCNSYKADFSIEETKMYLRIKPFIPNNVILFTCYSYRNHPDWLLYLNKTKKS